MVRELDLGPDTTNTKPLVLYCSLQHELTMLQQRQLDELSDWLRRMEALVSEDDEASDSPEPLQKKLEKHKVCV